MLVVVLSLESDPIARAPGQYARSIVQRLRMRTLVTLGVLAVATALLGRRFGLHDPRFLGAEVALLAAIFVISRYVLPLVERHDRGAAGEEHVGGLLDGLAGARVARDPRREPRPGQRRPHPDRPGRGVHGRDQEPSRARCGSGGVHGATLGQAQAQRRAIERVTGTDVEPLLVYSRAWVDRPLARRKGVRVLPARMLLGYLDRQPQRLGRRRSRARASCWRARSWSPPRPCARRVACDDRPETGRYRAERAVGSRERIAGGRDPEGRARWRRGAPRRARAR